MAIIRALQDAKANPVERPLGRLARSHAKAVPQHESADSVVVVPEDGSETLEEDPVGPLDRRICYVILTGGFMPEENTLTLRFASNAADVHDLEEEISSILREISDPASDAANAALAANLNPSDMSGAHTSVTEEDKGFGPVAILIAITVPVAAHIINKFWDEVIWPQIKGRLGADALGKRET